MPQGKYTDADIAQSAVPLGRYTDADLAPPEQPGLLSQALDAAGRAKTAFFQQMFGVSGPTEALTNIGETAGMVADPRKLAAGAGEFVAGTARGIGAQAKTLLKLTPPGVVIQSLRGIPPPPAEEMTAMLGGKSVAEAGTQAGAGHYAESVGDLAAGLATAATWLLPFKAKLSGTTSKELEVLSQGKLQLPAPPGSAGVTITPGALRGGWPALVESLLKRTPGGGRVAARHEALQADVMRVFNDVLLESGGDAAALLERIPHDPSLTAQMLGRALRRTASEKYYKPVLEAMSAPDAAMPALASVQKVADAWLANRSVKSALVKNPELSASVTDALGRLSGGPITIQGMAGAPVPIAGGSAELTFSGFELTEDALSSIKAIARKPGLSNRERRVLYDLSENLNEASLSAVRATGGEELAKTLQEGRAMVAHGYALEDFGEALKGVFQAPGRPPVAGMATVPAAVDVRKLTAALEEMVEQRPWLRGEVRPPTRLEVAIPTAQQRTSLRAGAQLLANAANVGQLSAAHFGILGEVGIAGRIALSAAPDVGPLARAALALPTGAWIMSQALTRPGLAYLIRAFLRTAPGTAAFTALGQRIAQEVVGTGQSSISPPPEAQ